MKRNKIIYWVATLLIFLFESVMPAFTFNSEVAKQGISHLGYPDYFRVAFSMFKVAGGLVLVLPFFPPRAKEWAYAGFTFDFVFAFISIWAVDGLQAMTFFPLIVLAVLAVSYIFYHKTYGRTAGNK